MTKKVKIVSFAIAIVLVAAVMTVAIYAAISGNATIKANVSWTATAGVEFEFEAWAVNNETQNGIGATNVPKSISKQIVTSGTSNTTANNLAGDLSCEFYDGTDDGVNNPSDVVFTYKIKNTGSNILKVTATKTPTNQAESGTTAANHKPAVALSTNCDGTSLTTSQTSALLGTGYNVPAGGTLTYMVTLSMSNAELNISSFDAGVTFNFGIGKQTEVYVGNVSQTLTPSATTIGDYASALNVSQYPGYYYDAELTVPVPEEDYDVVLANSVVSLYTKPATLNKLTFTSNGDGTCSVAKNGTPTGEVVIPKVSPAGDSVTSIGFQAFNSCPRITSLTIPNSVTTIGTIAFTGCSGLTSITIPDSVIIIEYESFAYCTGLTSITIPKSVTSIGSGAFSGCGLSSIVVESGNTVYESRNNCNAIIEKASNTLILGSNNSFIPDTVISIGSNAFSGCSELKSLTIPNSVASIGAGAFSECSNLKSINIPDGVTTLGMYTFSYCTSLTSITIPDSVTKIDGAFYGCSSLTSIRIPDGVTSIGMDTFGGCSSLTSITIPDSVTSIGSSAFGGCSSLKSLTIPYRVTSIGYMAFYGCGGLTSIVVASENEIFDSRNNCNAIIETASNKIILGCNNSFIPDGVTEISTYAFYGCKELTSITIPDSVSSINSYAFWNCTGLTSIYIPSTVTTIGNNTFYNCSSSLKIYCGVTKANKPSGWGNDWNYYSSSSLSVTWGVTRAQYNSQYA